MAHAFGARPSISVRNLTVAFLVAWFLLAVAGSLLGVFDSEPRPPLPLALAAVIPVGLFAVCYLTSVRFREFVWSLDLRLLTLAQTSRVGGIVFLILYQQGACQEFSPYPQGGEISQSGSRHPCHLVLEAPIPSKVFIVWNVLGSLDLVLAVSLGGAGLGNTRGHISRRCLDSTDGPVPVQLDPDVLRASPSDLASDFFEPCSTRTGLTEPAFCCESGY